jgi:hypothetical protein
MWCRESFRRIARFDNYYKSGELVLEMTEWCENTCVNGRRLTDHDTHILLNPGDRIVLTVLMISS